MMKFTMAVLFVGLSFLVLQPDRASAQDKVSAPKVVMKSRLDAMADLESKGFTFELKFVEDPCNLSDIVVDQFPLEGTPVEAGAEFTLSVNTAHGVKIPKFTGMTRSKAEVLASKVGLATSVVNDVVETTTIGSTSGRVCERWVSKTEYLSQTVRNQSPREGMCTSLGTNVSVHLPVRQEVTYLSVCSNCACP